jgi:predicted ATPase
MFAMSRLRMLEQEWRLMKDDQKQIERPFDDFRGVVNRLFNRKSIELNQRNELIAKLSSGEPFNLEDLSSGEKQLIIILGEALLQQGSTSIYLADEPELSLHVAWQEQLVSSIRELNSNAQLVFATHSPGIVGIYGDRVIDRGLVHRFRSSLTYFDGSGAGPRPAGGLSGRLAALLPKAAGGQSPPRHLNMRVYF